jgi:hypothetical protein
MTHLGGPLKEQAILNRSQRVWYTNLPVGNDPDYFVFYNDFDRVALDSTNNWTVVKDAGASAAISAAQGGTVVLTSTATTDDDGASIQGQALATPAAGRTIWFCARVKASSAADHDMFIGLTANWGTNPEDVLTTNNRIGFQIADGSAVIQCKNDKAGTATTTSSGVTSANATYNKVAFKVNGVDSIEYYVDDQLVATVTTNIPTAAALAPAFMNLSGSATGTHTATCDYIQVVQTR